jgi:catecholate siderophore receptor
MLAGNAKAADVINSSGTTAPSTTGPVKPKKEADAQPINPAGAPPKTSNGVPQLTTIVVTAPTENSYQPTQASLPLYTQPLLDTPQTITIVPQAVIKDQNATTLRDVLRNVPGISFQAGEASSTVAGDNLTIRGFNAREDLFVDGIRDTGIYTHDPFNTEQVEVVKGPASAYEGYGETGGSVNLVSKTPQLTPDYEFSGGVGTNAFDRESLDVNQPITALGDLGAAVRLNAFHQYNEVANRDFVYDGRWGFAPSIAFGLGTPTRVTFSYLHQREDDLPDYGFPFINAAAVATGDFPVSKLNQPAPLPYSNWYGFYNRDHETAITDMPTLKLEHDFEDGSKLVNETRYDRTSFIAYNTSVRFDTTPPLLPDMITREASARSDRDSLIDNKTFATIPFETWNIPHTLVASLELSRETDSFATANGPNTDTNLYDPNAFAPYPDPLTWSDRQTNKLEDVAFSLFDTIKFLPQVELTGGMRYDHLDSSYTDPGHTYLDRVDDMASWRVALVYKPVPFGSFYAGYGTSFNPSIQGISDGASNDALTPNTASLAPEEDDSYEVGTKWDVLDQKLSLNLALFRTEKTNAKIVDPTQPGTVYTLGGEQQVEGVEFDAAGNLTRDWKIFGGYVYMKSRIESGPPSAFPGNNLPNTPNQSASLWTTYDLPANFTIGTGGQFVDQRYSGVNELNSSPGYWTQQAMLGYKVNKNVQMQVNVSNLWDKHYIDLVGAHQVVPGAGRTIIFTTSFKF